VKRWQAVVFSPACSHRWSLPTWVSKNPDFHLKYFMDSPAPTLGHAKSEKTKKVENSFPNIK
jgi:hypothetical protein